MIHSIVCSPSFFTVWYQQFSVFQQLSLFPNQKKNDSDILTPELKVLCSPSHILNLLRAQNCFQLPFTTIIFRTYLDTNNMFASSFLSSQSSTIQKVIPNSKTCSKVQGSNVKISEGSKMATICYKIVVDNEISSAVERGMH